MSKDTLPAPILLIESCWVENATVVAEENLAESEVKNSKKWVKTYGERSIFIEGKVGHVDGPTSNRRLYRKGIMEGAITKLFENSDKIGLPVGEADHPRDGHVSTSRTSHIIHSLRLAETKNEDGTTDVIGRFEVIPTREGKDIIVTIEHGGRIGASLRGRGSVVESNGHMLVADNFKLDGWDIVKRPASAGAYMSIAQESDESENKDGLNESEEGSTEESEKTPEVTLDSLLESHPALLSAFEKQILESANKTVLKLEADHARAIEALEKSVEERRLHLEDAFTFKVLEAVSNIASDNDQSPVQESIASFVSDQNDQFETFTLALNNIQESVESMPYFTLTTANGVTVENVSVTTDQFDQLAKALDLDVAEGEESIFTIQRSYLEMKALVESKDEEHVKDLVVLKNRMKSKLETFKAKIEAANSRNEVLESELSDKEELIESLSEKVDTLTESYGSLKEKLAESSLTEDSDESLEEDNSDEQAHKKSLIAFTKTRGLVSSKLEEALSHVESGFFKTTEQIEKWFDSQESSSSKSLTEGEVAGLRKSVVHSSTTPKKIRRRSLGNSSAWG